MPENQPYKPSAKNARQDARSEISEELKAGKAWVTARVKKLMKRGQQTSTKNTDA